MCLEEAIKDQVSQKKKSKQQQNGCLHLIHSHQESQQKLHLDDLWLH